MANFDGMDNEEKKELAKKVANQILNLGKKGGNSGLFSKGGLIGGVFSNISGIMSAAEKLPEVFEKLKEAGFDIDVGSNYGRATPGRMHKFPSSKINNTEPENNFNIKRKNSDKETKIDVTLLNSELLKRLEEQKEELLEFQKEGISVEKALKEIDEKIKNLLNQG